MADSRRAHAKEYFTELLLPVSLSPQWATATPCLFRRPTNTRSFLFLTWRDKEGIQSKIILPFWKTEKWRVKILNNKYFTLNYGSEFTDKWERGRKQEIKAELTGRGLRWDVNPPCASPSFLPLLPPVAIRAVDEQSWKMEHRVKPCSWQGLGAVARCQACASEVTEPSSGYWSTRDLPAPRNNKQRKLSQRSLSQC